MIKQLITALNTARTTDTASAPADARRREIDAEWDRQIAGAINARDRAELDAIFSRAI